MVSRLQMETVDGRVRVSRSGWRCAAPVANVAKSSASLLTMHLRPCLAEALGTFLFVFIGAGAIIMDAFTGGQVGLLGIALAHGLALSIAVSMTMNVSGGQINPAVTVALWTMGKLRGMEAVWFVLFQLAGAVLAGLLLFLLFPAAAADVASLGTPGPSTSIGLPQVLLLEVIATFFLAAAIYGTAVGRNAPAGIAGFGIGLTVAFLILAIGPLTGAAMNPARHLGVALFAGQTGLAWLYVVGPVIGAILGFHAAHFALGEREEGKAKEAP